MEARASQRIPSPLSSPISPGVSTKQHPPVGQEVGEGFQQLATISASAAGLQDLTAYNDDIKVDVTALFESFGGHLSATRTTNRSRDVDVELNPKDDGNENGMNPIEHMIIEDATGGHAHSLPNPARVKYLEISFSSNDLTPHWMSSSNPSIKEDASAEKRARSNTYHGQSDIDQRVNSYPEHAFNSSIHPPDSCSATQSTSKTCGSVPLTSIRAVSSNTKIDQIEGSAAQILETRHDASSNSTQGGEVGMQPGMPNEKQVWLFQERAGRSDPRKRLSLITSGVGLAAASAAIISHSQLENCLDYLVPGSDNTLARSFMDLPSWELAPPSPPVEVKESVSIQNAAPLRMTARKESLNDRQPRNQELVTSIMDHYRHVSSQGRPPESANLMTPTTPLTTREARILAGREALLRTSPDKQRIQRDITASSTASSIKSMELELAKSNCHDKIESVVAEETIDSASLKWKQDVKSSTGSSPGGVFGALPQRGQSPFKLEVTATEKLVFPDQSLRPIPLKAYRVRKLTLQERNQVYAEAVQEFTRARTGLDIWALRSMMQDRPNLMKGT